jgi:hypothetical protein
MIYERLIHKHAKDTEKKSFTWDKYFQFKNKYELASAVVNYHEKLLKFDIKNRNAF